ncbi:hypothetical protein BCV69DRAFT_285681 [Microstroma glucosiphilum]|uniref:GYF domain-containing protein n=1 Tax=Pseudomicrostroma glucosiphilum TaxID=1684307 RepID=A0A316TWC9_9BASI|nr:hypothetical protein BCV69DRAFT_285681 [Pseudomicrostroma glucosiphilum]PWN17802.1 hypothetical protein BCV69DRAFT_285681 [Pseudomicrostroma glucosiphilum]
MSSSSKRKLPLSATAGLSTSEQAGQPGGAPSTSSLKRSKVSFATDTGPLNDDGSLDTGKDADLTGTDLDLEEQDRKRNQQGRKGRVVTEGYDSEDSDEEEEEEEEEEQVNAAAQAGDGGEEDDDMFEVKDSSGQTGSKGATAAPTTAAGPTSGKGKGAERYLSLGEIEGQEFQSGPSGALSDESDDEDRDPDLELEDEDEDEDEEGDEENIEDDPVAAGERTPPLSPGGTTVLPRDLKTIRRQKGLKGKAARKQKGSAARGTSSNLPAGRPGEGKSQAQMDFDDAAMGFKLDGFNMKSEMTSGRFDEEGNYIPNAKDPLAQHDKWLEGNYSKKGIRAAREAKEKRESEARRREREEEMLAGAGGMEGVQMRLLEYMEKGESVLETLQRLGKEAKKVKDEAKKAGKQQQRRSNTQRRNGAAAAAVDDVPPVASTSSSTSNPAQNGHSQTQTSTPTPSSASTPSVIKAIETFTSLISMLMDQFSQVNIYEEEYEGLLRSVRKSGLVAEDWDPARSRGDEVEQEEADVHGGAAAAEPEAESGVLYEYRWSPSYLQATSTSTSTEDPSTETPVETFGPYDLPTLRAWREAGYFGDVGPQGRGMGTERILLRRVGGEAGGGGEWKSWSELLGDR